MAVKLMTDNRAGHLQWCVDGRVNASFFVKPKDYGLRGLDDKRQTREEHEVLAQAIPPGVTTLLGLQVPLLETDVRDRMLNNVDLEHNRDFILEAAESYKRIKTYSMGNRLFTITVPLGHTTNALERNMLRRRKTTDAAIADADNLAYWHDQAQQFVDKLEGTFELEPVPESFLPYIWNHNLHRGNYATPLPLTPTAQTMMASTRDELRFNTAVLDEGGRAVTDLADWRAWFRPFVRVIPTANSDESSYQSFLVVDRFPFAGAWFPGGSEILTPLDGIHGVAVDWAQRISRTPRDKALELNTKALRKLAEQADEREGEQGFADQEIGDSYELLAEYNETLAHRDDADEISFTTIIAVGAPNRTDLRRNIATVRKRLKSVNVKLTAPRGGQAELFNAFNPGAPDEPIYRDYSHITTTDMWAGLAPFTTARILDDHGPIVGINLLSGLYEPLHIDFLSATLNDLSACLAISGELGSGKSYFLKTLCALIADLGGQFFSFDRSDVGEWEMFASSLTSPAILDFAEPEYSIDPLRMLVTARGEQGGIDRAKAAKLTLDTLLPLVDISPTEARGVALANMLNTTYRDEHPEIRSLPTLLRHIRDRAANEPMHPELHALAQSLNAIADIAPALFDDNLPALPLDRTGTVFRTHSLELPTAEQMSNEMRYRRLSMTARLGQAYYTFGGLVARQTFLRPTGRFGLLAGDEAHHFTHTDIGPDTINHFVRDGRKHQAAIALSSHDPVADYPGAMFDLIPMRFAFRHRSKVLARNSLEWLGADLDAEPNLIKRMTDDTSPVRGGQKPPEHRRGECFVRDAEGRIGRAKMLGPARPDRARAASSSPEDTRAWREEQEARKAGARA